MTGRVTAAVAVVVAVLLTAVPGTSAAIRVHRTAPYVRHVRVVRPAGGPASNALVLARVFRHGTRESLGHGYTMHASADGVVTVAIPHDDIVIRNHRTEHVFDVEAIVYTDGAGAVSPPYVLAYVLDTAASWTAGPADDAIVRLRPATS